MGVLEQAAGIAREAGAFIRALEDKSGLAVSEKIAGCDYVTEADTGSQQLIKDRVARLYPSDSVFGEEDGLSDPAVMDAVRSAKGRAWLVDPLDGTANFIHALGGYAVSIAVFDGGDVACAAVYLPVTDELFCAQKGKGAFRNGRAIRVSENPSLVLAVGATHVPVSDMGLRRRSNAWYEKAVMSCQNMRVIGSSVHTQMRVAAGGLDFYYEYGPHPWDVAAGSLIVSEAGGIESRLDGGPFDFGKGGVLASSRAVRDSVLRMLEEADGDLSRL